MLEPAIMHLGECFEPANGTLPHRRVAIALQRRSPNDHLASMIARYGGEERFCPVEPPHLLDRSLLGEGPFDLIFRRARGRRSRATGLASDIPGRFRCRR
jgi:hypothetical protein